MRIGIMAGAGADQDNSMAAAINFASRLDKMGFDSFWMANIFGFDAITLLSLMGPQTSKLELGTAVVPSFPRHPTALAQQCLTASVATQGRFSLGLGLSHQMVIENMFGLSYDKPARHMREYLSVLGPLLRGEAADFSGELYNVHCQMDVEGALPVPVILAALGPVMLKLAGQMSDGTTTWMTGIETLANYTIPTINKAAADAERPAPRVVAGLPIALTSNVDEAKTRIDKGLEIYGMLPSYRAMLDKEGAAGPSDVALLGDEAALRQQLQTLRSSGVSDFNAAIMHVDDGSFERTLAFLQSELG